MISLYDFLYLACEDCYEINIWSCDKEEEILHQKEVAEIKEYLEENDMLDAEIQSWDINEKNELTINI